MIRKINGIKVIKRADRESAAITKKPKTNPLLQAQQQVVGKVKDWINELNERKSQQIFAR